MQKNNLKVMAASMAASLGLALCASPVAAMAAGMTYTPVNGSAVSMQKYLTMRKQANVPNVTFEYSIAPGAAQTAALGSGNIEVYAGNDANKVVGAPTIGSVTFAVGQTTFETIQDYPASDGVRVGSGKDILTLSADKKYARQAIPVSFADVKFKEPGVYRYVITETSNTTLGIDNDNDLERIMDVYVEDNAGALQVTGYVLHNNAASAVVKQDGSATVGKPQGYTNDYVTYDLTLAETVSGNQASHDEYFKVSLNLSGGIPGTKYDVILTNADSTTSLNAINTESHTNPASITLNASGALTQDFWLQQGQSVVIQGLTRGTSYTVNEDPAAMSSEGYAVTMGIVGDTKNGGPSSTSDVAMAQDTLLASDSALHNDTVITFNNDRRGTVPTGVLLSVVPGVAVCGAGAFGLIAMAKKRKEDDKD